MIVDGIRTDSMNPKTGISKHITLVSLLEVAKDESGNVTKVPELKLENHEELKEFGEGKTIKNLVKRKKTVIR